MPKTEPTMDIDLLLSAQILRLAPELRRSEADRGLIVLKNMPARSYLQVTPEQWTILEHFESAQMVPAVLATVILERQCLPLGEFFELILKAVRAQVLVAPGAVPNPVPAYPWKGTIRPHVLFWPLTILFTVGMVMALIFHPSLPLTVLEGAGGLVLLCAALSLGDFVSACMIRGAGGEVYKPSWRWLAIPPHFAVEKTDAITLPRKVQTPIAMAVPSMLATAAGLASWLQPGWAFFPMLGLIFSLRPALGGRVASLIRIGDQRAPSDAEHSFLFPPNRRTMVRVRTMLRTVRNPATWLRLLYGVLWVFASLYWSGRLEETPVWSTTFWRENGTRIATGIDVSLALLAVAYVSWEFFQLAKETARTRRRWFRLWSKRWFGKSAALLDEASKMKAMTTSSVLCALQPAEREELAHHMLARRHGPWKRLSVSSGAPSHVSLIVSGKVSVRRVLPSGRRERAQVLAEGELIGLHDIADPGYPNYTVRTLTPVTLLTVDRPTAVRLISSQIQPSQLVELLLKLPFLRRIPLCRNWHLQSIKRFAGLATIADFAPGKGILSEGLAVDFFFIIFQGDALVYQDRRKVAVIRAGEFFGEIGVMQNSVPNASVTARNGTRCLRISRTELLRFVTHNYSVALEVEAVSSKRLGRPLFPLKPGDFRGY